MKKGEVWRVRFPTVPGDTQAGERPAVIMQNEPFLSRLPTVQIIPFTSLQSATRFPGTLVAQPDSSNGLRVCSGRVSGGRQPPVFEGRRSPDRGLTPPARPDLTLREQTLTVPSVALVFQFAAQDKRNVLHRLGELDAANLDRIAALLQQLVV